MALIGSGSHADPFKVYTADDLNSLRTQANNQSYVVLANDINLDVPPYNQGEGWEPLPFTFFLMGNGHSIKGLKINRPSSSEVGLFRKSTVSNKWTAIYDVNLVDVDIVGSTEVGAFIGKNDYYVRIIGCKVTGKIRGKINVGGIIGSAVSSSTYLMGNYVNAEISGTSNIAGLGNFQLGNNYKFTYVHSNIVDSIVTSNEHSNDALINYNDMVITTFDRKNYYNLTKADSRHFGIVGSKEELFYSAENWDLLYTESALLIRNEGVDYYCRPLYGKQIARLIWTRFSEKLKRPIMSTEEEYSILLKSGDEYFTYDETSESDKFVKIEHTSIKIEQIPDPDKEDSFIDNEVKIFDENELYANPLVRTITNLNVIDPKELAKFAEGKDSIDVIFLEADPHKIPEMFQQNRELHGNSIPLLKYVEKDTFKHNPLDYEDIHTVKTTVNEFSEDESYKIVKKVFKEKAKTQKPFSNLPERPQPQIEISKLDTLPMGEQKVSVTYEVYRYFDNNRKLVVTLDGFNKKRYLISINGGVTWLTYDENSVSKWVTAKLEDIHDVGINPTTLAKPEIWEELDTTAKSKIKYAIAMQNEIPNSTSNVDKLKITYAENTGPSVDDLYIFFDDNYLNVTAQILDGENDDVQFRLVYMQEDMEDFQPLYPSDGSYIKKHNGYILERRIPLSKFRSGNTIIKIETKDSKGAEFSKENSVLIYSGKTDLVIDDYNGFSTDFTIVNDKKNLVQFRIFMNGVQLSPSVDGQWTDFYQSPHTAHFQWDADNVVIGMNNELTIEARDIYGNTDKKSFTFIGSYKGLLFKDAEGNYYSTDSNEILQLLDFGSVIGGVTTEPSLVYLENRTGENIRNIKVFFNDPEAEDNVDIRLSKTQKPFEPSEELLIDEMIPDEVIPFYARIESDVAAKVTARKTFYIYASCDIV